MGGALALAGAGLHLAEVIGAEVAMAALMAGGGLAVFAGRELEAEMPQCETCGPMYGGRHHPDCPEAL